MPITEVEVLDVLRDPRVVNIRFSVGPINVNASEYARVADYIRAGAIEVEAGKSSWPDRDEYVPQLNALRTRIAEPPLTNTMRAGLLHECTHAIADINKCNVSRLADEAAGFLAQVTYQGLLESLVAPPIGLPITNMTRLLMSLVKKYHLGEVAGMGAIIDPYDVEVLGKAIHAIPGSGYDKYPETEMLKADGVGLTDKQAEKFWWFQVQRMMLQDMSDRANEEAAQLITLRSSSVAYENYVTDDQELLGLFQAFARGGAREKEATLQKLFHIFLTISQRSAMNYSARLSTATRGDLLSARFHASFPAPLVSNLLVALRTPR